MQTLPEGPPSGRDATGRATERSERTWYDARMPSRPMVFAVLALFGLAGCPESSSEQRNGEPAACERMGERCQLPDGPVGICSETTAPCDEPPCLACTSQH